MPLIYVIDDEEDIRESLTCLIESVHYQVKTFSDAQEFLEQLGEETPSCIISDVRMPGLSGLELQNILNTKNCSTPLIFISAHGDVPMAVKGIQHGAIDFLTKPVNSQVLLDAINNAVSINMERQKKDKSKTAIMQCFNQLTPREKEVMKLMVDGKLTKQIAAELGISSNTVDLHRAKVVKKMQVKNIVELVNIASSHALFESA